MAHPRHRLRPRPELPRGLAAWQHDPQRPRLLHFVAIEACPPAAALRAAAQRAGARAAGAGTGAQWCGLVPGLHRLAFEGGRVLLTLCVGELAAMLREQAFRADAVLLDGRAARAGPRDAEGGGAPVPARARRWPRRGRGRRRCGATCSLRLPARTPAPATRRPPARYDPAWPVKGLRRRGAARAGACVVIGAGLAGAAAAASLARRGWAVRVLDAAPQPAAGASGLPAGLLAPHQSPDDNLLSRLSRAGVRITLQEAHAAARAAAATGQRTGVLERARRRRAAAARRWATALAAWSREADAGAEARGRTGRRRSRAWWHANAGLDRPAALVRAWLRAAGRALHAAARACARIVRDGAGWQLLDRRRPARSAQAPLVVVAAAAAQRAPCWPAASRCTRCAAR